MFGINKNEKTQCKALNKKGDHCSKYSMLSSRYCIYHQETKSLKQTLKGIGIGLVSGIIVSGSPMIGLDKYNKAKENSIIESIRPEISVKIEKLGESKLHFTIEMNKDSSNYVDDFFFDFVIPGEYINITRPLLQNVGNTVVTHRSHRNQGLVIISETVFIIVSRLYSEGLYDFTINYIPTIITEQPDVNNPRNINFIDIPDYQKISYFWTYKGRTYKELYYKDLTDLEFIKKDNEGHINHIRKLPGFENYTAEDHKNWEINNMHITDKALIKKILEISKYPKFSS